MGVWRQKDEIEIINLKYHKMENVLILLVIFGSLFGVFFIYISARNKERMALIEKGADVSVFHRPFKFKQTAVLKWGMLLMGLAFGILIGGLLYSITGFDEGISYSSMILMFGGLSLVLFYRVERMIEQKKK